MKKALYLKLFKVLWDNYVFKHLYDLAQKSSNTLDDKIVKKINELVKEL